MQDMQDMQIRTDVKKIITQCYRWKCAKNGHRSVIGDGSLSAAHAVRAVNVGMYRYAYAAKKINIFSHNCDDIEGSNCVRPLLVGEPLCIPIGILIMYCKF